MRGGTEPEPAMRINHVPLAAVILLAVSTFTTVLIEVQGRMKVFILVAEYFYTRLL